MVMLLDGYVNVGSMLDVPIGSMLDVTNLSIVLKLIGWGVLGMSSMDEMGVGDNSFWIVFDGSWRCSARSLGRLWIVVMWGRLWIVVVLAGGLSGGSGDGVGPSVEDLQNNLFCSNCSVQTVLLKEICSNLMVESLMFVDVWCCRLVWCSMLSLGVGTGGSVRQPAHLTQITNSDH